MKPERRVTAQLSRFGKEAQVLEKSKTGENEFGNSEFSYTTVRTVLAVRTYPNRNTEVESNVGDRGQDRPVFVVSNAAEDPEPPEFESRISFEGQVYEVGAHTTYDTHVEFFGEPVIH